MLNDEQVDALERAVYGSTMDNLPMVLGKVLPMVFSEWRLTRAALDEKASRFFGSQGHGIDEDDDQSSSGVVPEWSKPPGSPPEVRSVGADDPEPREGSAPRPEENPKRPSQRKRTRKSRRRNQGEVDPGSFADALDGPVCEAEGNAVVIPSDGSGGMSDG